jgi:hypothetical protein
MGIDRHDVVRFIWRHAPAANEKQGKQKGRLLRADLLVSEFRSSKGAGFQLWAL